MNIFINYKKVYSNRVMHEIRNNMKQTINVYDAENMEGILDNYIILEPKYNKRSTFFGRISSPLFLLFFLVMFFIILPVKWFFTGKFYLKSKGKIFNAISKWESII